ncbi:MAG: DMT family transporter [Rhodospirillaceae bacterium]
MTAASDPLSSAALGPRSARWAFPILVVGLIFGAFSPIFLRLSETGPVATAAVRMIGQLPLFVMLALVQPKFRAEITGGISRKDLGVLLLSGVFFAGDLIAWYWAVTVTSVANGTFLANLTPIFVAVGSWLLFGERLSRNFGIGAFLAIGGSVVMMSQNWVTTSDGPPHNLLGDASAICAAACYAGYVLTVASARQRVSTLATMSLNGVSSAVVLTAVALMTEPVFWPQTAPGWLAIAGLVIIVQIGGQFLIAMSLAHLPANLTALMFLFQPAIPAGFAWWLFGERITMVQVIGVVFILIGLGFARRTTRAAAAPAEA